ncbi:TRAP transporter large permease subunit [Paracoccaceae bacterium]|jgi:tripartite ATP-independent transporter DctM subunit|nr:TRAP transporter large permease subunit [Paracoccaceae bacterium]
MFVESIMLAALFAIFCIMLLVGFHIAYTLFGVSILFTIIAMISDQYFDTATGLDFYYFGIVVKRIYAVMTNWILIAGTLFIFMGFMLEKSGIAERLLISTQELFGNVRGGMAITVALIGTLLAASTGIVGASVVLLGVLSLPIMINQGYSKELATGTVAASGCLGIIIPPSIMLVFMADQINLPAGDLFMGAFIPGLMLAALYVIYILGFSFLKPAAAPLADDRQPVGLKTLMRVLLNAVPILALMFLVLGSIIAGIATVTEASGVGALSATALAAVYGKLNISMLKEALQGTFNTMGYIFCIIVGASVFAFVVRALGGDEIIEDALTSLPFSDNGVILFIIFCVFLLGFFLDWIEITFIILPLIAPVVSAMDLNINGYGVVDKPVLVWFVILIAVTLQTSFLTPPVGYALFYIKGISPPDVDMKHIYKGIIPFVILQLFAIYLVFKWPALATWLPAYVYG